LQRGVAGGRFASIFKRKKERGRYPAPGLDVIHGRYAGNAHSRTVPRLYDTVARDYELCDGCITQHQWYILDEVAAELDIPCSKNSSSLLSLPNNRYIFIDCFACTVGSCVAIVVLITVVINRMIVDVWMNIFRVGNAVIGLLGNWFHSTAL
jgi:hypothetical protein